MSTRNLIGTASDFSEAFGRLVINYAEGITAMSDQADYSIENGIGDASKAHIPILSKTCIPIHMEAHYGASHFDWRSRTRIHGCCN
ncbi:hypothetical protein WNZ15_25895 [Roseibium sp. AS2]|uniref:hypothetical protein n=1 Tax=Roseibium sp. AS2 TaxID=3135781 RepID=UPI00316C8057